MIKTRAPLFRALIPWRNYPQIIGCKCMLIALVLVVLVLPVPGFGQQFLVSADRTNGVYTVGDTVHWQIAWDDGQSAEPAPPTRFRILKGGFTEVEQGDLSLTNKQAELTARFTAPGTLLLEIKWNSKDGKAMRALGGAISAPERIELSAPRPADFDEFWKHKLSELDKVPVNPILESVQSQRSNVLYWKLSMDNIRGTKIHGQIARPVVGEKLPALLIVQWAGVYPLSPNWVTDRAAQGWLAADIEAHDIPIDQPDAFYKELSQGMLKNYPSIGNTNRETSYFLRMYLSCYRAAEYLIHRPDWDGKTLVVMGGSQGGLQALMLAGLHPKITAALADVPAGCDMLGPDSGRAPGWPQWYFNTGSGRDPRLVREASRYYDVANFTPRIRCPVLAGVGLIDETCPPAGILAALNQVSSRKEVILFPKGAHGDSHGTHRPFDQKRDKVWLPALREGKPVPANQY
jgi:cephalosporin-C deacetylase-like acetyl esterase